MGACLALLGDGMPNRRLSRHAWRRRYFLLGSEFDCAPSLLPTVNVAGGEDDGYEFGSRSLPVLHSVLEVGVRAKNKPCKIEVMA